MPFDVVEVLRAIGDIAFLCLPIIMFALIERAVAVRPFSSAGGQRQ